MNFDLGLHFNRHEIRIGHANNHNTVDIPDSEVNGVLAVLNLKIYIHVLV